jgi:hypothetical protein
MNTIFDDDRYRYSITREEAKSDVGKGWASLLDKIYDNLRPETQVLQVKEKFGGLRFYVGGATTEEFDVIDQAEEDSYTICEQCGKEGKLREDLGWILTLCDEHYEEIKKNRRWVVKDEQT